MQPEQFKKGAVFSRLESPGFISAVREGFATLLEDRATDPDKSGEANTLLFNWADDVRNNKKIPRTPATMSIFRGVFFGGALDAYGVVHVEIDRLEKMFIE